MQATGHGGALRRRRGRRAGRYLENDMISVNGNNVLAFSSSIEWDIHRIQARGAAMTGGLYTCRCAAPGTCRPRGAPADPAGAHRPAPGDVRRNLSGTIVGNALPVIVGEIGGTQQQYTWIVTSSILASTALTPIAGKLADLFDKKKLLLGSIAIFALGSCWRGWSDLGRHAHRRPRTSSACTRCST
ncbi:MFS transporter [Georgenia sp. SUBG003]|uniref:MFS transporter n=1 Tax=Georgenia sp. SUBG003 TaxID=1497974 RepID=UPI003AB81959